MPKIIHRVLLLLILVAMFPPLLVARARALRSDSPRIHIIQDMDNQPRFRAQHENPMFADQRAMRTHPPGTVSRTGTRLDDHFYRGLVDGAWATEFPQQAPLTAQLLARGQERYNIFCAACHGESGDGLGIVHVRADRLQKVGQAQWVQPLALFDPIVLEEPVGQIFNTITHGIRTMPAHGAQIPEHDRWAIVAWVKALQRSQVANWDEIPQADRDRLMEKRRTEIEAQQRAAEQEGADG